MNHHPIKHGNILRLFAATIVLLVVLTHTGPAYANGKVLAYQAWWLPESWRSAPLDKLDRLIFFELKVDAKGSISDKHGWPENWTAMQAELKRLSIPLDLTLTLLDSKDFQAVFSSDQAVAQLLEQATNLAADKAVSGLHIDFEVYTAMPEVVLAKFRRFMLDLSKRLRSEIPARHLSVFLPVGGAVQIYDAASLAAVNQIVAQGYDAHWKSGATAGPVAPLDGRTAVTWKKALSQTLGLGVAKDKIFLSYPLYGYEWRGENKAPRAKAIGVGTDTTFAPIDAKFLPNIQISAKDRAKRFGSFNDDVSGSSYYQFSKNGYWSTGWFEGEWALTKKIAFMKREQFAGLAFFVLGYDGGVLLDSFVNRRTTRPEPKRHSFD
jgi:spore germination protein